MVRHHAGRFMVGVGCPYELLEKAKKKLIGTRNTRKQIEGDPVLMKYVGDEKTDVGTLRVYRVGDTLYKYLPLPEPCPETPIHLMELRDIVRLTQ